MGRFAPGLPKISDGQQLFVLNGLSKLTEDGRMAIVQNGSPLFSGDAGSGPSEIRRYMLETNDWLEAIVQLPNDSFMNTGIATYIWVFSKAKAPHRRGKVQLIDASHCFEPRKKAIGFKRNDITEECCSLITAAYNEFQNGGIYGNLTGVYCESKVFDVAEFGYRKVVVERPQRDETGKPIKKKGKLIPDKSLRDTENIPLMESVESYMQREVLPYAPDAWVDESATKIGYEIPMTRYFYKYQAPESASKIASEISLLEEEIDETLKTLFQVDDEVRSARMKESGVPWLGQIPEHWQIEKGKHILSLLQRPVSPDAGVVTCFRDGEVTLRSNRREEGFTISFKEIGYQGVEPGDLVVHGMDGFAGSIGVSDSRGKCTPVLNILDCTQHKRFLMYYLRNMAYGNVFLALSTGIRQRSCDTNWNKLSTLPYSLPPIEEQQRIAAFLDEKCAAIDTLIEKKKQIISKLENYKKSLVYEYVTSKKEVHS